MSEAGWRASAEKTLGGRPFEALTSLTPEGLRLQPLYPRNTQAPPLALRGREGAWAIAQRVDHPDPTEANRLALLDLEGGASALTLVFADAGRGGGLPLTPDALETALSGVELDLIVLRLEAGGRAAEAVRLLGQLTTARRLASAGLAVDLGLDPLGTSARTGAPAPIPAGAELRALREAARAAGLAGALFLADGRPYHEAGAGEAQELAATLATGLSYLRQLENAGIDLDEARGDLAFLLAADAETFLTLTKFRALRRLWARVEEACELTPRPVRLHAETSWRMMTRRDPATNLMRATAAALAAGLGGADVVGILPFTAALGCPDDGARRLARNTQVILQDEAHLADVDDPAAGSGGLEAATQALCERAWDPFRATEAEGGLEASLRSGALQARVAAAAARRREALATGERGITGTSTFPLRDEPAPPSTPAAPLEPAPPAMPAHRDAEPFEALRDRADAMAAAGARPSVLLVRSGSPARCGGSATYAADFFAAAGLRTTLDGTDGGSAARIVCLCPAPDVTAEEVAAAAGRARGAGAERVLAAIDPPPGPDRAPGVDVFIHRGCNMVQVLGDVLDFIAAGHREPP